MKLFAILACLLYATASLAQQNPVKKNHSLKNTDNMPVHNERGDALDMPTRNGKGNALAIPNRPMPVPDDVGKQTAMLMQSLKGEIERMLADSSNQAKPTNTLPFKKDK